VGVIVVGFVDTPEGRAALDEAVALAGLRGDTVAVVHSMVGGTHESAADYVHSADAMNAAHERLHAGGVPHCTHEYVRGNTPARDLLLAVDEHRADTLVIGVRRRSATGKLLLGSNSLEILHDADVPVVCVKAPRDDAGR